MFSKIEKRKEKTIEDKKLTLKTTVICFLIALLLIVFGFISNPNVLYDGTNRSNLIDWIGINLKGKSLAKTRKSFCWQLLFSAFGKKGIQHNLGMNVGIQKLFNKRSLR